MTFSLFPLHLYMTDKYIILLLLFVTPIFLTRCSVGDENQNSLLDNTISFRSKITTISTTKSLINSPTFPDGSSIGIYSWGHHKNDGEVNTTLRTDLTNALYTKEAGKDELIPTTEAHFPMDADTLLNFYAYHPYTEAATNQPGSIPFDLQEQADVMWADPVKNRGKASAEATIGLKFNHLLSAITLVIEKANDTPEALILQSISLENYAPTFQFDVQTGDITAATSTEPYRIKENINSPITTTPTTIAADYLLCPIEKPTFIILISNREYRAQSTKPFLPGKRQTYHFTIQGKGIQISGQIKPWEDGGSSNETVIF